MDFLIGYTWFFFFYLLIYMTVLIIRGIYQSFASFSLKRRYDLHSDLYHDNHYPISVLYVGRNDLQDETIYSLDKAVLEIDYPNYEVLLMINDLDDEFRDKLCHRYNLHKLNGWNINNALKTEDAAYDFYYGKVSGVDIAVTNKKVKEFNKTDLLNSSVNISNYPYYVVLDVGDFLQEDALRLASKALLINNNITVIGGKLRVSNRREYKEKAFIGTRLFDSIFNSDLVMPGEFGVFNKQAVINVGGYSEKINSERELDLTLRLHKQHKDNNEEYKITYVPQSVVWAKTPTKFKWFKKKRQRKYIGVLQSLWQNKSMIFNPKYKNVGTVKLPIILMFEVLMPFVAAIGWIVVLLGLIFNIYDSSLLRILGIVVTYILLGIMISALAITDSTFIINKTINWKDVVWAILISAVEVIALRPILYLEEIIALIKYNKLIKG